MKMLPKVTQSKDFPPPFIFSSADLLRSGVRLSAVLSPFIHTMTERLELPCGVVLHMDKE